MGFIQSVENLMIDCNGLSIVLTEVTDADGSDDKDDWAEVQKAIDKHQKVFVPKGVFRVGRTVRLGAGTKLVGISRPLVLLGCGQIWPQPALGLPTHAKSGLATHSGRQL